MKTLLTIAALLLMGTTATMSADKEKTDSKDEMVWICTGRNSQCYHRVANCRGLETCGGNVRQIKVEMAQKLDRRECKICYKPQQKQKIEK